MNHEWFLPIIQEYNLLTMFFVFFEDNSRTESVLENAERNERRSAMVWWTRLCSFATIKSSSWQRSKYYPSSCKDLKKRSVWIKKTSNQCKQSLKLPLKMLLMTSRRNAAVLVLLQRALTHPIFQCLISRYRTKLIELYLKSSTLLVQCLISRSVTWLTR